MLECSKCGCAYPDAYHFKNDGRTRPLICHKCYDSTRQAALEKLPFNFGAAFLPAIWCLCHSRTGLGLVLILANLISRPLVLFGVPPVLVWILWVGITLVFGFRGSSIAFREGAYGSLEEFKDGERSWQVAGVVAGIIEVGLVILVLLGSFE